MRPNDQVVSAYLVNQNQRVPITAKYASKDSLWINFQQECEFAPDDTCTLIVKNNGDRIELGPCRVISDPAQDSCDGRLVFLEDFADTTRLLSENQTVRLQTPFVDLPLKLARKNSVKKIFKEYVANLGYDLQVYQKLFDGLDEQYSNEPKNIRALVQHALIQTEGKKFEYFFDSSVQELNHIVKDFCREEHQLHGSYFRMQLMDFILCCPLMARTNLKPRGYPGDSKMMQMIYLNDYQGRSTFSKLMQKYTVGTPAAQSVRNRRTTVLEILKELQARLRLPPQEKIKVLSVASGPAWELEDILNSKTDIEKFEFTLLDQDPLAHKEASQVIDRIEKQSGAKVSVNYVQASVRSVIANKVFSEDLGKFDYIYSMGLFDYLSTPVAKRVLERLHRLLSPRGELVVGNFHVSNTSRNFMEYWGDWYLNHRTEDEFTNLLQHSPASNISVVFEATGNQMFLHVNKRTDA